MLNIDELVAHLEIENNIMNEKRANIEKYEQGVRAMKEASNMEGQ